MKILLTESQLKLITENYRNDSIIKMGLKDGDIMVKYKVWDYDNEKEVMGLNENNEPPIGNIRDRVWNKFQEESNFNAEVVRYYVDRFRHLTGEPLDEKILNHTWDHIKSTVDSHNDTITNKGDVKSNFINSFNHVWENYDKFECAYIWDDEEMDIQDSLGVIANLVMKDPSLLSSVPENELSKNLKYLVKILHDKTSIILYRVLFVKSLENINYNNLGTHWTYTHKAYHKDVIQYLYDSAENTNDDYEITPNDLYIIKVLSPTSNISYPATLWASICFGSSEHEVTLFQTNNLKILKSKHFKIPPSWDIH